MGTPVLKTSEGKGLAFRTFIQRLCESIDSPRSLALWLLITSGKEEDFDQLVNFPFDPLHYRETDVERFAYDYLVTRLCSKSPNLFNKNLVEPALRSFCRSEDTCKQINLSLLGYSLTDALSDSGVPLEQIRRSVNKIVGRAPSLTSVGAAGGWGPGSNYDLPRSCSTPEAKCATTSVTLELCKALERSSARDPRSGVPAWLLGPYKLVPGNLVTSVPKNAKTDRTIAIEPAVNSWFQKGIGSFLRSRLRRFGIDLNDQSHNQRGAMRALGSSLATIDLSAASDSISLELIRQLFPSDWVALFEATRSQRGAFADRSSVQNDDWFEYDKISSMGNGFTFELESVLFTAICHACNVPQDQILVYGDDIIIPRTYVACVAKVLQLCGFSLNRDKSFVDGLFFESCGVHVFCGCDVTPFFCKEDLNGPENFMHIANELRIFATRLGDLGFSVRHLLPVYRWLVRHIPSSLLVRGPEGGGLCLFSNPCEIRKGSSHGRVRYNHLVPQFEYQASEWQFSADRIVSECSQATVSLPSDLFRRRFGLGETPWLSQFRLFQLSSFPVEYPFFSGTIPDRMIGNVICRPTNRRWTVKEKKSFSAHDRALIGCNAYRIASGLAFPGTFRALTQWK